MKIVVLDGHTLNPGDLSWDPLRALGELEVHDRTALPDVVTRAGNAAILLTNKTPLHRDAILALTDLRYIGVLATGYNVVDAAAATERNIPVTNVPIYGTRSVAQLTFALLLELAHRVGHHAQSVSEGQWATSPDFSYWHAPLIELEGLTLGVIGFGRIGRAVADLAAAFGMKVLVHSRARPAAMPGHAQWTDLDSLLSRSDVVSLHCPLTPETRTLINRERLALMPPRAFLLNTSRGPLIDEDALAEALDQGRLAGAGLDVLSVEPPQKDHPLFHARNCFITPHLAWATHAARSRLMRTAIDNVRSYLSGTPQNVVNGVTSG
jgi:glycerate dehydrogenase